MIIIPIETRTLKLITDLNGGVEPMIEENDTFFLYDLDDHGRNDIVDMDRLKLLYPGDQLALIPSVISPKTVID